MGAALSARGFDVAGPAGRWTDTHQVWVRPSGAIELSNQLAQLLIRVNVQSDLPNCPGPMWRLGTSEVTVLGGTATDMDTLAEVVALVRERQLDVAEKLANSLRRKLARSPDWRPTMNGALP